ncbi:hypothetical protein IE53DRAFT_411936 [Violaceomyces palustris]|uniref:Uncharacterized protein n=1 Tax=Violaceomyces palustris TaxID=1673888 RepID=A0ACD0NTC6_9BASI|nr:hypothetical protein IE53DRAFT_411936 [Violaceomyces palustris]
MSVDLSDPSLKSAIHQIQQPSSKYDFIVIGYGGSQSTLKLYELASGGPEAFKRRLRRDEPMFGVLRVAGKFLFVQWLHAQITGVRRARALVHGRALLALFGPSVEAMATLSNVDDMTPRLLNAKLRLDEDPGPSMVCEPRPVSFSSSPSLSCFRNDRPSLHSIQPTSSTQGRRVSEPVANPSPLNLGKQRFILSNENDPGTPELRLPPQRRTSELGHSSSDVAQNYSEADSKHSRIRAWMSDASRSSVDFEDPTDAWVTSNLYAHRAKSDTSNSEFIHALWRSESPGSPGPGPGPPTHSSSDSLARARASANPGVKRRGSEGKSSSFDIDPEAMRREEESIREAMQMDKERIERERERVRRDEAKRAEVMERLRAEQEAAGIIEAENRTRPNENSKVLASPELVLPTPPSTQASPLVRGREWKPPALPLPQAPARSPIMTRSEMSIFPRGFRASKTISVRPAIDSSADGSMNNHPTEATNARHLKNDTEAPSAPTSVTDTPSTILSEGYWSHSVSSSTTSIGVPLRMRVKKQQFDEQGLEAEPWIMKHSRDSSATADRALAPAPILLLKAPAGLDKELPPPPPLSPSAATIRSLSQIEVLQDSVNSLEARAREARDRAVAAEREAKIQIEIARIEQKRLAMEVLEAERRERDRTEAEGLARAKWAREQADRDRLDAYERSVLESAERQRRLAVERLRQEEARRAEEAKREKARKEKEEKEAIEEAERRRRDAMEREARLRKEMEEKAERMRDLAEKEEQRLAEREGLIRQFKELDLGGKVVLNGSLTIQGAGSIVWRRRWFELHGNGMTLYKSRTETSKVLGEIRLRANVRRISDAFEECQMANSFKLEIGGGQGAEDEKRLEEADKVGDGSEHGSGGGGGGDGSVRSESDVDIKTWLIYTDTEQDKEILLSGISVIASVGPDDD